MLMRRKARETMLMESSLKLDEQITSMESSLKLVEQTVYANDNREEFALIGMAMSVIKQDSKLSWCHNYVT